MKWTSWLLCFTLSSESKRLGFLSGIHVKAGSISQLSLNAMNEFDAEHNRVCQENVSLPSFVKAVPLPQACRLLNTGATVLVSSSHAGKRNLMAASWNMPVDFDPPKLAVIVDRTTFTRTLIEASGEFALCIPPLKLADLTFTVGSCSGKDLAEDKFTRFAIPTAPASCVAAPLVRDCVAWLECRLIREERAQQAYDLLVGDVVRAWADERAFADGRYRPVHEIPPELRTIHHLGAGQFVVPGQQVQAQAQPP